MVGVWPETLRTRSDVCFREHDYKQCSGYRETGLYHERLAVALANNVNLTIVNYKCQ